MDDSRLKVQADGLGESDSDPLSETDWLSWDGGHGSDFAFGGDFGEPITFGTTFGADYANQADVLKQAQTKINGLGYTPALKPDGIWGPKTSAGVTFARQKFGLGTGGLDDSLLKALAITPSPTDVAASAADPIKKPSRSVAIATMAKALREAGAKLGHPIDDTLLSMMLGQMLGAEGAMPGLWNGGGYTLRGTNNIGAAQVPGGSAGKAFAAAKKLVSGWGGYAHKDSNPGNDEYIGWYYIAPNAEQAAEHWLTGFAGTHNVLTQNPRTPADYARIMYNSHYFTGTSKDSEKEIAAYAKRISGGMPPASVMNGPANDPTVFSVDPSEFASMSDRKITEALFNKAKAGKSGGAWQFLLPPTWDDLVKTNGVVWFGPAPLATAAVGAMRIGSDLSFKAVKATAWILGGLALGAYMGGPIGAVLGGAVGGAIQWWQGRSV